MPDVSARFQILRKKLQRLAFDIEQQSKGKSGTATAGAASSGTSVDPAVPVEWFTPDCKTAVQGNIQRLVDTLAESQKMPKVQLNCTWLACGLTAPCMTRFEC